MSGYTWNFNLTASGQPQPPGPEPRWIFEEAKVYPVSESDCLVVNVRTRAQAMVRVDVLNALQHCRRFRTLDEHAAVICKAVPPLANQQANVRQVLKTLAGQGLLREAGRLLQDLQAPSPTREPPPLEWVYIRTAGRPTLLRRLLQSLADNESRHGNRYRYGVLDDSGDADTQQHNRQVVDEIAAARNLAVTYIGAERQRRLQQWLVQRFPDHGEALAWLLGGSGHHPGRTYGRTWNQALLLAAGSRFLLLDDDAVCRAFAPPEGGRGVTLSAREEEQAFFFDSREQAFQSLPEMGLDPLALHGEHLGHDLSRVLNRCAPEALDAGTLSGLDPRFLPSLSAASPVRVTGNNVLGDPGTNANLWLYLNLRGDSRRRFTASEAQYRRYRSERLLWKGSPRLWLAPEKSLMSTTLTGLDNRTLLPPTLPELPGEDGLFGAAVNYLYPQALFLQFPWALAHLPEPPRRWGEGQPGERLPLSAASVLEDRFQAEGAHCPAATPERRTRSLAALCRDLADGNETTLQQLAVDYRLSVATSVVRRLNEALRDFSQAPAYWQEDVQSLIKAHSQPMAAHEQSAAGDGEHLRRMAQHYGAGLDAWPELWNHCREEREALWQALLD